MRLSAPLMVVACSLAAADASPLRDRMHMLGRDGVILAGALKDKVSRTLFSRGQAPSTAPSGNYAPSLNQQCPTNLVRQPANNNSAATVLFSGERDWVTARRSNVVSEWSTYLKNSALNLTGFDIDGFLANASNLPNVAVAVSGGGYRAMLHGAGVVNAFDGRNSSSVSQGTGGIMQLATYMAGLSGGSWFVGSLAINDFPTIGELRNLWNLTENLVDPSGFFDLISYYVDIQKEIDQKDDKGFDLSLTDYWGRALSRHLVNNTNNGLASTFSSVQNLTSFTTHNVPFPIIISDSRRSGETLIPVNTTIYEFTPFEFGSWNPSLQAFIPMENLGTAASNGVANKSDGCVTGYDNMGFIMGTSATLFNIAIYDLASANSTLGSLLGSVVKGLLGKDNDIATYPNPFTGLNPGQFAFSHDSELDLVDGGEDNENIPLWPLIHQEREVDVILSLDGSADNNFNWPNGSSLVNTRQRMQDPAFAALASFPNVPADVNTFVNEGLNAHTTFFGCNDSVSTPLIVYIPNAPYTAYTNFSTFQLAYTNQERDAFLENGFREARGNDTALVPGTPSLPTCLACALVSRAERRAGKTQSPPCQACFSAYCWNGVGNSTEPETYAPSIPDVPAGSQPGGAGSSETPTPSTTGGGGGGKKGGAAAPGPRVAAGGLMAAVAILAGALTLA